MKFHIIAALLGYSQAIKITASSKARDHEIARMQNICKNVQSIEHPGMLLQLEESPALPIVDKRTAAPAAETATKTETEAKKEVEQPEAKDSKNIKGSYEEHYGKTKEEVDKENKHILDTQKTCLEFVKSHQGHPEVCEWCQKEYKRPEVVWKWNPEENTWYRWYDGGWHYWGPSKDGFTEGGWSWYNGHWHNDGYVFKYENNTWSRFQDHKWVPYGETVPVNPEPPTGGKICRPFYKMMKEGFPQSLASSQVPRCKVGDQIYMWTDEAACKFLGGAKGYQERVVCKSGEEHKWKRVVKCVVGQEKLANGGFDYKTKQLHENLYPLKQCESYSNAATNKKYLYLFGEMKQYNDEIAKQLFASPTKIKQLTEKQFASAKLGKPLKPGSTLVSAQGGSFFLDTYTMDQFESEEVFKACQFDKSKVMPMDDKEFATKQIGDIITV